MTVTCTVCQPVAPSGAGGGLLLAAGSGPGRRWRARGSGGGRLVAAHGSTHWRHASTVASAARVASCHGPLSTCTSTLVMPRCWAQATPAMATVPAVTEAPTRGTSMREAVLIGPLGRPAARGPVALVGGEPGDLELGDPLGGRHVAVEPRHDQPRGEAVLEGQRLAVHGHGDQRVAVVGQRLDRGARGEPVAAAREHHVGPWLRPGHGEQVAHRPADPRRRCR